ncbi:hypothetical protein LUZ60_005145 [Juncus effusus]|nr:hypothetical protein LUZ60_005145 [Juncus effusus]
MDKSGGTGKSPAKESKKSVKIAEKSEYIPYYCDSPVEKIKKSVKMAGTCDYIPCSPSSSNTHLCEQMQDTPDYIRRSNERCQITPVELFSNISPKKDEISPDSKEIILSKTDGDTIETLDSAVEIKDEVLMLGEDKCEGCGKKKREYEVALRDKAKIKMNLEELKRNNEAKTRQCNEALTELHELKMELMRKSMHVGSLAFAVEGQVKEKSKWFQSLNGLSEKLEVLKLEHSNLSNNARKYKEDLHADFSQLSTALTMTVDRCVSLQQEREELKCKFLEETKERKDLYNKLIELKGNIRVFCRCRPMNAQEIEAADTMVVDFESAKEGELVVKGLVSSRKVFKFDSVFSPDESQEQVFEKTAPLATSVLDGFNVCIFAYGQTGTGKAFTMEGTLENRGVNYRTLEELFRIVKEREGLFRYDITVSVLEVYNEQIHDLLQSQPAKRLEVKQVSEGVHHVPGLMEAPVHDMLEAWSVLQSGSKARVVGATNSNEHSSRSHCMHCVMVRGENLITGEITKSKLWLIDLAGSERVGKTDAQGERLKEAQNINKSLSALGDVISALATKSPHIPFRNSKLTHILQDSLSGDSKTLMFVQISPNEIDVGETLCSLNFASRVRGIELGPAKRQVDVTELSRYKQLVGKAKQDNKSKDLQIQCMADSIQSLELRNKSKDQLNKTLQDKIRELESQLLVERKIARQHVDTKIAEDHMRENNSLHERPHELEQETGQDQEQKQKPSPTIQRTNHRLTMKPLTEINLKLLYEKENTTNTFIQDMAAISKAKRVSMCPPAWRVNPSSNLRRSILTTIPDVNTHSLLPSTSSNNKASNSKKKGLSIFRRSLQKKVVVRPPLWQAGRRVTGENKAGGERKARRVVVSENKAGGRVATGQQQGKQRGWNWNQGIGFR